MTQSVLLLWTVFLFAGSQPGLQTSEFDLERLQSESECIVTIHVLTDEAWLQERIMSYVDAAPHHLLACPTLEPKIRITFRQSFRAFAPGILPRDSWYVAFLKRDPTHNAWTPSDPYNGLLPAAAPGREVPSSDLRQRIVAELGTTLESPKPEVVRDALAALAALEDKTSLERVRQLAQSTNEHISAYALQHLYEEGGAGPAEVLRAVQLVEQSMTLQEAEKDGLASSIRRIRIQLPVNELNKWLKEARSPKLQAIAAQLLVEQADETSYPALISGLDLGDPHTQYYCIKALSRLTGGRKPTFKAFLAEREQIINEWRDWWRQESLAP